MYIFQFGRTALAQTFLSPFAAPHANVQLLLQHGADPNIEDKVHLPFDCNVLVGKSVFKDNITPLHHACERYPHRQTAKLLIEYGADVTHRDKVGLVRLRGVWLRSWVQNDKTPLDRVRPEHRAEYEVQTFSLCLRLTVLIGFRIRILRFEVTRIAKHTTL